MEDEIIKVIKGSDLKLRLDIDIAPDITDYTFKIDAYTKPSNKIPIDGGDCYPVDVDNEPNAYFVPIVTSTLEPGILILDIILTVDDTAFEDLNRTEIYRKKTNIKIVL